MNGTTTTVSDEERIAALEARADRIEQKLCANDLGEQIDRLQTAVYSLLSQVDQLHAEVVDHLAEETALHADA